MDGFDGPPRGSPRGRAPPDHKTQGERHQNWCDYHVQYTVGQSLEKKGRGGDKEKECVNVAYSQKGGNSALQRQEEEGQGSKQRRFTGPHGREGLAGDAANKTVRGPEQGKRRREA